MFKSLCCWVAQPATTMEDARTNSSLSLWNAKGRVVNTDTVSNVLLNHFSFYMALLRPVRERVPLPSKQRHSGSDLTRFVEEV